MSELKKNLQYMQLQSYKGLTKGAQKEIRDHALKIIKNKFRAFTNNVAHDLAKEIAAKHPEQATFTVQFDCENEEWSIVGFEKKETVKVASTLPKPVVTKEPTVAASKGFKITFANGPTISEKNDYETFVAALKHIGLNKIPEVGITFDNINLVEAREKDATLQKQVDGVYIYSKLSHDDMISIIKKISGKYYLGVRIEEPQQTNLFGDPAWDMPEKKVNRFVKKVLLYLKDDGLLDELLPYIKHYGNAPNRALTKDGVFHMTSIFILTDLSTIEYRNQGHIRWFTTPFMIGGKEYYLSNQWKDEKNYSTAKGLQCNEFKKMLEHVFPGKFVITKSKSGYHLEINK